MTRRRFSGRLGATRLETPSAGNAACAMSAYAARGGLAAYVFMPEDAPLVNQTLCVAYGARLYLDAGADAIFPEALETPDEFAAFARAVEAPLLANMTEFGRSPNLDFAALAQLGYRIVIYPVTALRVALRAAQETLTAIRERGHQRDLLPRMLTRAELYDLLGYSGYEERDRKYFG